MPNAQILCSSVKQSIVCRRLSIYKLQHGMQTLILSATITEHLLRVGKKHRDFVHLKPYG